ncbi:MAG: hypothetical protein ACXVKJ_08555, partial [Ilumatobacteraceae bacterium]
MDEDLVPTGGPHREAHRLVRAAIAVLSMVVLIIAVLLARGWRPTSDLAKASTTPVVSASTAMPTSAAIESTYGIRFTGVDVTAGGGMIQIRYQVLDSDKTQAIHGTDPSPYVIDGRGAKYADPGMVGHSHVGKTLKAGATDYILLANAMGGVKAGSFVTIKV